MKTGDEVLFEFEEPKGVYIGQVSAEGVVSELIENFDKVMNLVRLTAQSTYSALEEMRKKPSMPNEYEVKFGLKLTVEAGVVFAKMGTEGTFEVTLRWGTDT